MLSKEFEFGRGSSWRDIVSVVEDEDDEQALELEADEGETLNCTAQKILLVPKYEEDNQFNKIFRTRGTINDKMCNMIIDSYSSEKIVPKALVDMMGLSIEKILIPYKIW